MCWCGTFKSLPWCKEHLRGDTSVFLKLLGSLRLAIQVSHEPHSWKSHFCQSVCFVVFKKHIKYAVVGRCRARGLARAQDWHWLSFSCRVFVLFLSITLLFKLHNTTDAITLSAVQLHLLANWIKCARVKTCEYFQIGPRDELETCPWWFLLWQVDSWD